MMASVLPLVLAVAPQAAVSPGDQPASETVVSVDPESRRVVVRAGSNERTLVLPPVLASALELLHPGQEVRFSPGEGGAPQGFVITGPPNPPKAETALTPGIVPEVPPLPQTSRQGKVLAVDQPGKRLVMDFGDGHAQTIGLEGNGARTLAMIDPGEDVLLYLKDPSTAVAFIITGWPVRG
jgi:hypothetical protein